MTHSVSGTEAKDFSPALRKRYIKNISVFTLFSVLCAVFAAVYTSFGHGVSSYAMSLAFLPTLAGGSIPLCFLLLRRSPFPGRLSHNLWCDGIATITVGMLFFGVIEIYGTTSSLSYVYFSVGTAFLIWGFIAYKARR